MSDCEGCKSFMQNFLCRSKKLFPRIKKKKEIQTKPLMCVKQCGPALKISYHSDGSFASTDCALVSPSPAFPACSYTTRATLWSAVIYTHLAQVQTPSLYENILHRAILVPCFS